ncbi:MAG: hypothetical protein ACRERC_00655 [Candidatus Binatia bacterium]
MLASSAGAAELVIRNARLFDATGATPLDGLAGQLWNAENLDDGLAYSRRNLVRMHRAGVPIVAATDAPSVWPEAIYHFHGPQTAREVELLGTAGLPHADAIIAATRTPRACSGARQRSAPSRSASAPTC